MVRTRYQTPQHSKMAARGNTACRVLALHSANATHAQRKTAVISRAHRVLACARPALQRGIARAFQRAVSEHQQGGDEPWGEPLDDSRQQLPVEENARLQTRHDVPARTATGWSRGGRDEANPIWHGGSMTCDETTAA